MSMRNGFTMVELMVSLAIGLLVTLAVSQVYLSSRDTYGAKEELSRLQENARFASEFIARDLRMAGYMGCNSKMPQTQVGNIVDPQNATTTFNVSGIRGFRYECTTGCTGALTEWAPALPAAWFAAGDVVIGSDVFIVQRASDLSTHLTGNTTPVNANVQIHTTANVQLEIDANDVLMVADCKAADVFRATGVSNGSGKTTIAHASGNTQNNLAHFYGPDAEIMKLLSRAYYIGKRGGNANAAANTNPPSLFRKELSRGLTTPSVELVEGIERMVVRYGEDTLRGDRVADRYLNPDDITNYRNVVSVQLALLLRTLAPTDTIVDARPYQLLDVAVPAANDRLRRRIFTSTIDIRNH